MTGAPPHTPAHTTWDASCLQAARAGNRLLIRAANARGSSFSRTRQSKAAGRDATAASRARRACNRGLGWSSPVPGRDLSVPGLGPVGGGSRATPEFMPRGWPRALRRSMLWDQLGWGTPTAEMPTAGHRVGVPSPGCQPGRPLPQERGWGWRPPPDGGLRQPLLRNAPPMLGELSWLAERTTGTMGAAQAGPLLPWL